MSYQSLQAATSDTVRPTSHTLQCRTKEFTVYTNSHQAVAELHPLARFDITGTYR